MNHRLVYLDNIKVFLISYVITGHIAASYGAIGGGKWTYIEPGAGFLTRAALTIFVMVAYAFLMGMFIFISGYFTFPSVQKKGTWRFIRERMVRLGIPLAAYYFLIGPLVKYIIAVNNGFGGSFLRFLITNYHSGIYGYLGVMWFVVLILIFSIIYALFLHIFPAGWLKPRNHAFPGNGKILLFLSVVGLMSFLARIAFPLAGGTAGSRPLGSIVFFATSFFLGTTVARYHWLDQLDYRKTKPWFYASLLVMVLPVILYFFLHGNMSIKMVSSPGSLASLAYSFWEVIKTLGTGMIAVVAFRKWLNTPGKLTNALGRSVFLAFFIHPLICVLYLINFASFAWHPLLKFAVVAPVSLASTFLMAWLLLKIPVVRKII